MTDRYAVVGNPVEHSLSPVIHAAFARQTGESLTYDKLWSPVGEFVKTVDRFFSQGGRGLNVTVPFKEQAAAWVDELSGDAASARVVNTIARSNSTHIGYNTDGIGLVRDLERNLGIDVAGERLLLLGAGGAARGIVRPLLAQRPAHLVIANRTVEKARQLVNELEAESVGVGLQAQGLADVAGRFDLVLNCTSAGLRGIGELVPASVVREAFCYDLVYAGADDTTAFCRWARAAGAHGVSDGLGMLIEQAAEAFYIWRGKRPVTQDVFARIRGAQS